MRSLLLAVDDGLTNANYNWADIFFLVGTIAAVLAALAAYPHRPPATPPPWAGWAHVLLALAVGCAAFGLFLL